MTAASQELRIEFLFLDLESCARCRATDATLQAAIERTRPALDAVGVAVNMTRTLVSNEALARSLGFASSPTIRINGVDIAGELVESACDTCAETCACNGEVDCRDWVYQGERSTEPPVGLIVEAIMRHAVGLDQRSGASQRVESAQLPAKLHTYFGTLAATANSPSCCAPSDQASCCEADHKAACCGDGPASSTCGCQPRHGVA